MRLSEAVFWDFPLTPHKVRTEQEQKAEQKHFKQHGRKTESAAALRGKRRREGDTDQKRRRGPRRGDRIITVLSKTINQTRMYAHTYKNPDRH